MDGISFSSSRDTINLTFVLSLFGACVDSNCNKNKILRSANLKKLSCGSTS